MFKSITEMAREYINEIKAVQPEGPYTIVGMCFGGWVAFEMAQQLVSNGDEMQSLVILDSEGPFVKGKNSTISDGYLTKSATRSRNKSVSSALYKKMDPKIFSKKLVLRVGIWPRIKKWWKGITTYSREAPLWVKAIQHYKTGRLRELVIKYIVSTPTLYPYIQRFIKPKDDETTMQLFQKIKLNQQFLKRRYSARRYPNNLVFIRSEQYEERTDKQHHIPRWRRVCDGEVKDYLISGRHLNMMEPPQVDEVAEIISRAHVREISKE